MTLQEIKNRLKDGEICTLITGSQKDIEKIGFKFGGKVMTLQEIKNGLKDEIHTGLHIKSINKNLEIDKFYFLCRLSSDNLSRKIFGFESKDLGNI